MLELGKIKVQNEALMNQMAEYRKNLRAETEDYVARKKADTDSCTQKLLIVEDMLRDFYLYNDGRMTGDEFSRIIIEVVNGMGEL